MIAFTVIGRHTSFPSPTFNFMEGWENAAFPCYLRRFDNTTVWSLCSRRCMPLSPFSPTLLFNKQRACLTYSRFPPCLAQCDEQLNGVTVNRGGSVALLWQHSFDVEVVVLACHVLPFCSFTFLFLLCLDLTAVTRWRSQLAWPESVTATRKLPFFSPLIAIQYAYIHTEKCSNFSRLKNFNWLSLMSELVSQDAAECQWCIKYAVPPSFS